MSREQRHLIGVNIFSIKISQAIALRWQNKQTIPGTKILKWNPLPWWDVSRIHPTTAQLTLRPRSGSRQIWLVSWLDSRTRSDRHLHRVSTASHPPAASQKTAEPVGSLIRHRCYPRRWLPRSAKHNWPAARRQEDPPPPPASGSGAVSTAYASPRDPARRDEEGIGGGRFACKNAGDGKCIYRRNCSAISRLESTAILAQMRSSSS